VHLVAQTVADSRPLVSPCVDRPSAVRVAYLTNVYPKTSHSFIRREIMALERQGFDVQRFSVRSSDEDLPDGDDRREHGLTAVLLDGGVAALLRPVARLALTRPGRLVKALRTALSLCTRGPADVPRHLAYLAEACRLILALEASAIRHVHVHFGTNPAAVALLATKLGAITFSMTVHGPDEFDAPVALSLGAKATAASFVVAVSHFGRGQLMRWLSPPDWSKINVVKCGIDLSFRAPTTAAHGPSVQMPPTLVCIARLNAQKGLPLLIEASRLVADRLDFRLRIIGSGEMHAELEAMIIAYRLSDQVVLLGARSSDGVRDELIAARALVLPSFAEGLPVVLMEALSLGRPVISTVIAGIPELVDATCGWLVPSGSAHLLAETICTALRAEPETLAAMGAVGRRRIDRDHDADANARQLAELLRPLAIARPAMSRHAR